MAILREIRDVMQEIPQFRHELETAMESVSDLAEMFFGAAHPQPVQSQPVQSQPVQSQPVQSQPVHPQPGPLRSGGARDYIPLDFGGQYPKRTTPQTPKIHRPPPPPLDPAVAEQAVLTCFADGPKTFDAICQQTKIPAGVLSATLLTLELTRRITRMAGDRYKTQ